RPTLESELAQTHFRMGTLLAGAGRKREAVVEWRRALAFDTDNYVIRKQIWAVEHPERFQPEVDYAWQKEQLRREQEEEASLKAQGCGPDGCPIPPR
ncbi:MAG TPA: hypothetical protein VFK80_07975, partial [Limnochordia bacterium]|nr:hypothetical protein [Limnochordia bacterium]